MKKLHYFFEEGEHKWAVIARDPDLKSFIIDTNEYLVISDKKALLLDPGGVEIFPDVFSAINQEFNPLKIEALFASHQDPDIISSLSLWLELKPELKCYLSWLWGEFIPHFGGNEKTFNLIPDAGQSIKLGQINLQVIPAHFLHSSGNFHLYDPKARVFFSGDVGAALLPKGNDELFVNDFDQHVKHAKLFHQRWMGSNRHKNDWCQRVSALDVDMLCPQHGGIYQGQDVERFINWFAELKVGYLG